MCVSYYLSLFSSRVYEMKHQLDENMSICIHTYIHACMHTYMISQAGARVLTTFGKGISAWGGHQSLVAARRAEMDDVLRKR